MPTIVVYGQVDEGEIVEVRRDRPSHPASNWPIETLDYDAWKAK